MPNLGPETKRSHYARQYSGFYAKYCHGKGADIGYKGSTNADPLPKTIGIDLDTPGYDGIKLPLEDNSLDFIFTSHIIEHCTHPQKNIKDWHRVVKPGGYIIIIAPHQYLYEKKAEPPSRFAPHHHFFTPGKLLLTVESALNPNSYRIRHLKDNDTEYTYDLPPEIHCGGACEIELVLQKIEPPEWEIK